MDSITRSAVPDQPRTSAPDPVPSFPVFPSADRLPPVEVLQHQLAVARAAREAGLTSLWRLALDRTDRKPESDGLLARMLGFGPGELSTLADWSKVLYREDSGRFLSSWRSCAEGRSDRFECEFRLIDRAGDVRWFHARGARIPENPGQSATITGVVQEITERKTADEELHELSRYNRQLLDLSPDPIFVLDTSGVIMDVNPAAQVLTGSERSGLIGGELGRRFADPARVRQLWIDALAHGTVRDAEIDLFAKSASKTVPLLCNATALAAEDGSPRGVLVVARDISARKAAETERLMTEARVRETQKLESLGVLAGGIAHDFNNLLTGILGNASLAKLDLATGTPPYNCVEEIEKAALRAAELCRQMLAYSGKGRFVVQLLDLSELITEAAPLLELSTSKKARLRFFLNKHLPLIQADVNQLRQIIINLVSNAAEAIGEKEGQIRITTGSMRATRDYLRQTHLAPDLPEGAYVFVEVSDSGSGMTPEILARIFEPFYTTKFTGRGLGLSAVLGIVRGHRAAIKVESEPGRGSSFLVLFPAAEQVAALPAEPAAPKPANRRILVVDDEATVRSVMERMLRSFGYEAVVAGNGHEAVQIVQERRDDFRAVLLDLTMPELDGAETFREIHRLAPDLPVVLMSGYSEQDAVTRFGAAGLAGFLQKPFQPDTLRARIAAIIPA